METTDCQGDMMDIKIAEKTLILLVLFAFLLSSTVQVPVCAQAPADTEKILVFLKDVVGIDVEKYEVTLVSSSVQDYTNKNNPIGNLGYIQTSGAYKLVYWDTATETYSDLEVMFSFANETIRLCSLNVLSGEPYYNKPLPSEVSEAARVVLERYGTLSGDMELTTMRSTLTAVDVTKNSSQIDGNLKLEVITTPDRTSLSWIQSQNGVDYNSLTLEFEHGVFLTFFDSRGYRTVGSAEVNISKEQAIETALKEAGGFSYTYNDKLVDNLTIVENQIRAELKANVRDTPTLFYPCWVVDLPLNAVYPGSIYYIEVLIWADTGQIISCKEMGYGGPYPDGSSSNVIPSESFPHDSGTAESADANRETNSITSSTAMIVATVFVVVLASTLTAALIIKKHKSK